MRLNRRSVIFSGVGAGISVAAFLIQAQSKAVRKLMLGQSVPLTGAADQIGLAYLNGAKMYFDALNAKKSGLGVQN